MTFDRFIKQLFAEELSGFPNTVYKNDCWYSFTPQGIMHQVFVFRSHLGASIELYYGSSPLVAPLKAEPGNSMKKLVFERPEYMGRVDYARRHPEIEDGFYSDLLFIRVGTAQEPQKVDILRAIIKEVIIPYFHLTSSIPDLYRECINKAAQQLKEDCVVNGFDVTPYIHFSHKFRGGEGAYALSYLHKQIDGLVGILKRRTCVLERVRRSNAYWEERGDSNENLNFHETLNRYISIYKDEEHLLLLPEQEQQQKLREIFEENRAKIHDLLRIAPEFDMDFIFPEG